MSLLWKTVTYECDMYRSTWEQNRITGAIRNLKNTHTAKAIKEAQWVADIECTPVGYDIDGVRHYAEPRQSSDATR